MLSLHFLEDTVFGAREMTCFVARSGSRFVEGSDYGACNDGSSELYTDSSFLFSTVSDLRWGLECLDDLPQSDFAGWCWGEGAFCYDRCLLFMNGCKRAAADGLGEFALKFFN